MEQSRLKQLLVSVWPTLYRIINSFLFFLLSTIKSIVLYTLRQLKGGF